MTKSELEQELNMSTRRKYCWTSLLIDWKLQISETTKRKANGPDEK